jgi:hypothetical protein
MFSMSIGSELDSKSMESLQWFTNRSLASREVPHNLAAD